MNMTLEDICDCIRVTKDGEWFLERFEITIEDMVLRFKDLIEEEQDVLPLDLEMEYLPTEYEDRWVKKKELDKTSYDYKRLKAKYPHLDSFFEEYYGGDYLNKAYSTYYDIDGKELEVESYSHYGWLWKLLKYPLLLKT